MIEIKNIRSINFWIILIVNFVLCSNILSAKEYSKQINDWTFLYIVNDQKKAKRKLNINSINYKTNYSIGFFLNNTFPIFIKKFPLEINSSDGSSIPKDENDYIDAEKIFVNNLEIPTFQIKGKKGTFFGLFETSAGASGRGGYTVTLVNLENGIETQFYQDANGELFNIYNDKNEIIGFVNYRYDRAVGWYGNYPEEITLWGNLSGSKGKLSKNYLLKKHLEEVHEVLKPFSKNEVELLEEYQRQLVCDSYGCFTLNQIYYNDQTYSQSKLEPYLKKMIMKVIYQKNYNKKLIPEKLIFMEMIIDGELYYNGFLDFKKLKENFDNGFDLEKYYNDTENVSNIICSEATQNIYENGKWIKIWETDTNYLESIKAAKKRGLNCNVSENYSDFKDTRKAFTEILNFKEEEKFHITQKVPFGKMDIMCSRNSIKHSIDWDYDLIEVFEFMREIKEYLSNKNLEKFMSLFRDEVDTEYFGPFKRDIIGKEFEDIFSKNWVDNILEKPFQCSPAGYRGFYMGVGELWFDNYTGSLKIRGVQFYN